MLKKVSIIIMVCIFLIASIGCASKPATQTPQASGKNKEPYQLKIYTYSTGTFTYVMGMAMAELINKNSTWLKATAVESPGSTQNEVMVAKDASMQKNTLYYGTAYDAYHGFGQFKDQASKRSKTVLTVGLVLNGLVAMEPSIKKVEDLAGKKVLMRSPVTTSNAFFESLIKEVVPSVTFQNLDFTQSVDAVLNGKADAWLIAAFSKTPALDSWALNPASTEFANRAKNINFINNSIEVSKKLRAQKGSQFENFYYDVITLPPKAVHPNQTEPWNVPVSNSQFLADQDMPEDVVYEIVRIVAENSSKLKDYHPQGAFITPQTMAIYTFPEEFHPGALKYYKEAGVKPISLGELTKKK